ncbi:MAG: hypothetical protein J7641_23650 [Cyanobacteria bacterium SID2]|nr:hypothetical protein [Cyanobacteria bacterium SID2]MBP0005904.1 hypothetical protein [Cyanobacteria bacterium SBC]
MKRRKFLIVAGVTAGVVVVSASIRRRSIEKQLQNFYQGLRQPDPTPTGSIASSTLDILGAVTVALLPQDIELTHYQDFFRWRAENLAGFKDLYEKFAETLDQKASQKQNCEFAQCDRETSLSLIQNVLPPQSRARRGRLEEAQMLLFGRDRWLFQEHIINDIFQIFARTDALKAIGYKHWFGQPRGLEEYRRPRATQN